MKDFQLKDTISPIDSGIGIPQAGIGYICIPKNVDRDMYVNDCLRTNTVSILGGVHSSYFHNVSIDTVSIQRITFPKNSSKHGTPVIWIKIPLFNKPVIIATLKYENDYYQLDEFSRNETLSYITNIVDISKRAKDAVYDINIKGSSDTPGEFNINIKNEEDEATFNLHVQGNINLHATKQINLITDEKINLSVIDEDKKERVKITYEIEKGFYYKDEFGNEIKCVDGEVQIISKKINHNDGKEPMVLGDTLQEKLEKLIDTIMQLTVSTAFGPSSVPINNPQFSEIKSLLKEIKSKKSNLD